MEIRPASIFHVAASVSPSSTMASASVSLISDYGIDFPANVRVGSNQLYIAKRDARAVVGATQATLSDEAPAPGEFGHLIASGETPAPGEFRHLVALGEAPAPGEFCHLTSPLA